jgi:general stress protein YciG
MEPQSKRKQGLAAMDPEKRRAIARLGGQTVQRLGTGHRFTPEEARKAGKKEGRATGKTDNAHLISQAPV